MKSRMFLSILVAVLMPAAMVPPGISLAGEPVDMFPTMPVRLVVPIAAGGSADKLARVLAQRLAEKWRQPVVVENIPGAASTIGTSQVARARPDGYTLLLGGDQLSINTALGRKLPYDPVKDLRGVIKAVENPQLLAVSTKLGVKNFADFLELLKKRPGEITLGLPSGAGSYQQLAVIILTKKLGVQTNNIPYQGGGPVLLDLLGGHIDSTLITLAAATEHVRNKTVIALGVTTPYRSKALPDVPTLQELGVEGYSLATWQGIVAPRGTPDALIEKIYKDITEILHDSAIAGQLESLGFNIVAGTPEDVDRDIAAAIELYTKIVRDEKITVE
jgi:tripartite-type tricarboxylate transporter receptor subunit TctC